jgi:predicted dehydrogenase
MKPRVRVGVIGYGYWGPNVARSFSGQPQGVLAAISDLSEERLAQASANHPGATTTKDAAELIGSSGVDAVAIAVPVSRHFELGMAALRAGKHVLMAKPLTASDAEAEELCAEADRRGLTLMVDHTFVYSGPVRKIRELTQSGDLGSLYYYDSVRVNLGLFQGDVNVLWDLAVHDLAILDYIVPDRPVAVSALGMSHVAGGLEDQAYLTLHFDRPFIAHVHVNWLAPVKVRRTLVGGSKQMIVYDDVEPSEKVKVYDSGVSQMPGRAESYDTFWNYRMGDVFSPRLSREEPLRAEAAHFLECIANSERPVTDGPCGRRLVRILEAATISMREAGRRVDLKA